MKRFILRSVTLTLSRVIGSSRPFVRRAWDSPLSVSDNESPAAIPLFRQPPVGMAEEVAPCVSTPERSFSVCRRERRLRIAASVASVAAVAAILILARPTRADAQYQQIPNFTGIGAGYNFRQAINARLGGQSPIAPQIASSIFANLPAEQDGLLFWCHDCAKTTPCTGGGSGAWALGARGTWACSGGALEEDLNINGHDLLNAASVNAQNAGDLNPRESLVAGLGIRMSNGAAAPYTVIDENANVTAHVNGVINVKAPPYNAKGDGSTDDWNAIQTAIYAACGATPPATPSNGDKPSVYLPATPNGTCYSISQPLKITCPQVRVYGAGLTQSDICQQFQGPDVLLQSYAYNTTPLVSNIAATWQASHSYSAPGSGNAYEIKDSNGNIELAIASGTSGATQPSWPTVQGMITNDGSVQWALTVVGGSLAAGSGSTLDGNPANNEFGDISGPIINMSYAGSPMYLTGLGSFTAEGFVEIASTTTNGGGGQLGQFVGSIPMQPSPGTSNPNGGAFELGATNPSGGNSYAYCEMRTGTTLAGSTVHTLTGVTPMTAYKTHFEECSYDGANIRLFLDGNLETTQAATGPIFQQFYETVQTTYHTGQWPDQALTSGGGPEYVDSIRLLNVADHTASYAPPTAKLTSTPNTLILMNFPTTAPFGTVQAVSGTAASPNVYLPYQTNLTQLFGITLDGFNFCPSGRGGLYANAIVNSKFEDLFCRFPDYIGFYLNSTDFEDRMVNVQVSATPSSTIGRTVAGFVIGAQGNDNTYDDLFASGVTSAIVQEGGSGVYTKPVFSDFGSGVYPFVFEGAQFQMRHPFTDIEDSNPNFISNVYDNGAWAPGLMQGGELDSTNSGGNAGPFTIVGGAPIIDEGTSFGGAAPAELFDIVSAPTSPNVVRDPNLPSNYSAVPITNSGESYWVRVTMGAQDLGMKFADLPGTVVNGVSRYCKDCDPPANPPVACTSSGAKTGAWVRGINGVWRCTY